MLLPLVIGAACGGGPSATVTAQPAASSAPSSIPVAATPQAPSSPIVGTVQIESILSSADFAAVGVKGAGTPTVETSGDGDFYVVYAGESADDGGIELDIFLFDTASDAADDFGGSGEGELGAATLKQIGADRAAYYSDEAGNSAPISYDEIDVLKGAGWFDLEIPSGSNSKQQLVALAALVVARGGSLF